MSFEIIFKKIFFNCLFSVFIFVNMHTNLLNNNSRILFLIQKILSLLVICLVLADVLDHLVQLKFSDISELFNFWVSFCCHSLIVFL